MSFPVIGQKEIALFFFPLMLNVQLMSVSHSIINGALARQSDPITTLASFSVAMILHLFVASPSYQNHTVTIAMVRDRRSLIGTTLFVIAIASYVSVMLALLAFSPLGDWVLSHFLGVEGEIAKGVKEVISLLVFLPFFTGLRGLFQGLVIRARKTSLVSLATGVRIGALSLCLLLGGGLFSGVQLAAFALLVCIAVETALMGVFAWRCRLPYEQGEGRTIAEVFRFAFPLAFSSGLQQAIPLIISAIISRLPDSALALASFGVIRGFVFLLAGPLRNLQQAYLTLVKSAADYRALVFFFRRVSVGTGLLMALIAYPLNAPVLGQLMGLDEAMRDYIALPMAVCALFPLLYGASNLLRGMFAEQRRTGTLGKITVIKVGYLLLCWGAQLWLSLPVPGIALALFLLLSAELLELLYLRARSRELLPA